MTSKITIIIITFTINATIIAPPPLPKMGGCNNYVSLKIENFVQKWGVQ
jgi:hypothetical protein